MHPMPKAGVMYVRVGKKVDNKLIGRANNG